MIIQLSISICSWDSAVSIEIGYGLDNWGIMVQFLVKTSDFCLLKSITTGSGIHTASYSMGINFCVCVCAISLGVKELEHRGDQ